MTRAWCCWRTVGWQSARITPSGGPFQRLDLLRREHHDRLRVEGQLCFADAGVHLLYESTNKSESLFVASTAPRMRSSSPVSGRLSASGSRAFARGW